MKADHPSAAHDAQWTFMTNHTHVLLCLATAQGDTLREVASRVGITERAVQRIVGDLEAAGVVSRVREGRRNRYAINADLPLRHPLEAHRRIHDLLTLLTAGMPSGATKPDSTAR